MTDHPDPLDTLQRWFAAGVASNRPDLTARQMAVLLICYRNAEPQTVRGMAAALNVAKPAITRALDRLSDLDLIHRKTDPLDRRNILTRRTTTGAALIRRLAADWQTACANATVDATLREIAARTSQDAAHA